MAGRRRLMFAKNFTVDYLRFTALESGTFTLTINSAVTTSNFEYVEYSVDEGVTWVKTDNVASTTITVTTPTVSTGDSVLWRGKGLRTSQATSTSTSRSTFSSTGRCNVSGNINTLLKLDKPKEQTGYLSNYAFRGLFYQMTKLVDASGLIIPKAGSYAFQRMFYGCTTLTSPPVLPEDIGTGNPYCCSYMFYGCTALQKAPALPSINLSNYCYEYMFYGCTSLISAPELPATTLGGSGYYTSMFQNCSSLTYIKADFGGSPTYCNENWASGIASEGTFIKSPNLNAFYPVSPNLFSVCCMARSPGKRPSRGRRKVKS